MTDWKSAAERTSRRLRRNAFIGGAIALLVLTLGPLTAGAYGFSTPLGWMLLLGFCLVTLAFSAHLLFDAALFRLAASYDTQHAGLSAIDDLLARMGLRTNDGMMRSLPQRMAGCARLLWRQRIALVIGLALYIILLVDAENAACLC